MNEMNYYVGNETQSFNEEKEEHIKGDIKALVPIRVYENKVTFDRIKNKYRKGQKGHIIYIRIYMLFFFLGACAFASGMLGGGEFVQSIIGKLSSRDNGFSEFCISFAPVVFGSFLVYASGFTVYAPLLSFVYSALFFSSCGAVSAVIVYSQGITAELFLILALIGLSCGFGVIFCSVAVGISKIASDGIGKLNLIDGLLYSVLYWGYIATLYFIIMGIERLICL